MSRSQRLGVVVLAVVVIVAVYVIAKPSGDSGGQFSGKARIVIVGGKPKGGVAQLRYKKGQTVDLTVTSDVADEIHIHGYDLHQKVARGASVHFAFPATTDGQFVIELERRSEQIASLNVIP